LDGTVPPADEDRDRFSAAELAAGWRLACRARVLGDLKIELAQWSGAILGDDDELTAPQPQPGWGIAVDLGTTTVVAQLLDLENCRLLGVRAELNVQARHGADVMSRIEFAMSGGGQRLLERLVREQIGRMARELLAAAGEESGGRLRRVVVVGNTAMHHLFCGIPVAPLATHPFEPATLAGGCFPAAALGWEGMGDSVVHFLPCLGGFVGSDLLAGLLATRLAERSRPSALIDLGTNGEIIVGNQDRIWCASTAAGPAFEGARISCGMRAASGAVSRVTVAGSEVACDVLGGGAPRGLCGSGLVDAVAAGLELNWIQPSGRLAAGGAPITLAGPVQLTQSDVRELQLAKGAIAAGLRMLTERWGAALGDLEAVYLAGAFGNYLDSRSARRIGLLDFPAEKVRAAGNTALRGAKMALFIPGGPVDGAFAGVLTRTRHLSLNEDLSFQETFAEEMTFPRS